MNFTIQQTNLIQQLVDVNDNIKEKNEIITKFKNSQNDDIKLININKIDNNDNNTKIEKLKNPHALRKLEKTLRLKKNYYQTYTSTINYYQN